MKRLLSVAFVIIYVVGLAYGNLCHLVQEGKSTHPIMYFLVWDMFCGWTAYDSRFHVVAEGESGKYYELTPPPYGEFKPFGYIGRENYDQFQSHTGPLGLNVLRHTRHEPMTRVVVIEECWAKKYNMTDAVWQARYDDPKDITRYYRQRVAVLPDGTVTSYNSSWLQYQFAQMKMDNPRLIEDQNRSRTLFVMDNIAQPGRSILEPRGAAPASYLPAAAPSGN